MPKNRKPLDWLLGTASAPKQRRGAPGKRRAATSEWRIKVAVPICLPARRQIELAMEDLEASYGGSAAYRVESESILGNIAARSGRYENDRGVRDGFDPLDYAVCATADIVVPTQRARWVEYLILRQHRLAVVGALYDERNRQWARGHDWGSLPIAWNRDANGVKPWATKGCSEATPKLPPTKKRRWWQRKT